MYGSGSQTCTDLLRLINLFLYFILHSGVSVKYFVWLFYDVLIVALRSLHILLCSCRSKSASPALCFCQVVNLDKINVRHGDYHCLGYAVAVLYGKPPIFRIIIA